jgi:type I restriction enzyme S subunit
MGNIQQGIVVYDKLVYSDDEDDIKKYHLEKGDLLFNRTNSKEWVGKTAIYKGEREAIYAGYLVRFKPILIDSRYLNYVMQSQYYWSFCQRERTDAIGQSNINAQKLKKFYFPLPPLSEQKRIIARLEELLPYCDQLIKRL